MSRRLQPQWLRQAADYADKPLIPSPYDDEFDTDALDSKWTMTGVAGSSWDSVNPIDFTAAFTTGGTRFATQAMAMGKPSWFRMQCSSTNPDGQVMLSQPITLPTNATVWAKFHITSRLASQASNDSAISIGLYDTETTFTNGILMSLNRGVASAIQPQATRHQSGSATTIGGLPGDEDNRGQPFHTVAICKRGTDYHCWALAGEHGWFWIGNITLATTLSHARIYVTNGATTAPGNSIVGVDFFRFSRTGRRP